jgi:hypothetical protein
MNIQSILFKMGIGTWVSDIITPVPSPIASTNFQVGKTLPTDVGFIYGLSVYADGVDSQNNPLISTTQAQNLFLCLQDGPTQFMEDIRLSDLLNEFAGSPVVRPDKFTPVNIAKFDLSKSSYKNPLSFTSGVIHLKIWYVNSRDWAHLKTQFPLK